VEYLATMQSEDGGFRSTTYGVLRSGQSLTPLVLGALMTVPEAIRPTRTIERGLDFIQRNTDASSEDYPNYAAALAVSAIAGAKPTAWQERIAPIIAQLRAQQFTDANGWRKEDAPYGAWGMGGPVHRPPDAGHVDLSMTRCVLQAMQAASVPSSDPAMKRAAVYLKRSQSADGGFYFSTVNLETNKAGETDGRGLSYGTATADGLLALRAAGIPDSDTRNSQAIEWLKEHHRPDRAPGFEAARESWGSGLRFYYAYVISLAMPELPVDLPTQGEDGSFSNSNKLVKEDDPLIATSFAIHALS
jgi:hypothetical protein